MVLVKTNNRLMSKNKYPQLKPKKTDFYYIIDKYGSEIPKKSINEEERTLKEAFDLVQELNINGEHSPYSIICSNCIFRITKIF